MTDAEDVQRQLATAVRRYAARREAGEDLAPFPPAEDAATPTPTEVSLTASAMLAALDIELFELALWRSWGGGR